MKKSGILNPQLAELVASMGHGDILMVADRGVPFPQHDETVCIDLSVRPGLPGLIDVLETVLEELEIESVIIPNETQEKNPEMYKRMQDVLTKVKNKGNDIVEENIPHVDCKNLFLTGDTVDPEAIDLWGREVKGIVRTGECTPFSYIMLVSGTTF